VPVLLNGKLAATILPSPSSRYSIMLLLGITHSPFEMAAALSPFNSKNELQAAVIFSPFSVYNVREADLESVPLIEEFITYAYWNVCVFTKITSYTESPLLSIKVTVPFFGLRSDGLNSVFREPFITTADPAIFNFCVMPFSIYWNSLVDISPI